MDILKMLAELRAELQRINEAIITMERLAVGTRGKRRGRPPKWMVALNRKPVAIAAFRVKRSVAVVASRKGK